MCCYFNLEQHLISLYTSFTHAPVLLVDGWMLSRVKSDLTAAFNPIIYPLQRFISKKHYIEIPNYFQD